jgi:hypothetical protein
MKLSVTSPAFQPNGTIPRKHTGQGEDVSPAITWSGAPSGTAEFALLMDDPDAPAGTWVHWVIYKIPGTATGLKEGIEKVTTLTDPAGALQGKNSWGRIGYGGPLPPPGSAHHYHFKVHALDKPLSVSAGLDKAGLLDAMRGHVLAEGELVGTYQR